MSELRKDPVLDRWVIIAPERGARPQEFEPTTRDATPSVVCPMCAGNERMTAHEIFSIRDAGEPDRPGWYVRVVPNKFPALRVEGELAPQTDGLLQHMNGIGAHEIIIETPRHEEDLAFASDEQIIRVLTACRHRVEDLHHDVRFRHVTVFRNHRLGAGAKLGHPHTQVVALPIVPKTLHDELSGAARYHDEHSRCVYCDIVDQELDRDERVIITSEHFVALAPYASPYAYGVSIYPRRHSHDMVSMNAVEQADLAGVLRRVLISYRAAVFNPPYSLVYRTGPSIGEGDPPELAGLAAHYHWHIDIMPRLSTAAGFEWDAGFQINPVAPEEAARELRENLP